MLDRMEACERMSAIQNTDHEKLWFCAQKRSERIAVLSEEFESSPHSDGVAPPTN